MRIVLCIRNFFYQLCLISIVILILALSRSLLPTLSGIEDIFPSNISRHFNAAEFNSWRIQRANFTLEHISKSFNLTNEDNQVISIIIIASGREGYFLTQVIAAFIEILQTSNLYASISICNVSTVENEEIDRLSHIVNFFSFLFFLPIHNFRVPIIKPIKQFAYNFNKYEERLMKESNDYWFCMNATHNSRCTFIFKYFAHYVPIIKPIKQFAYNFNKYEERLMKESNDYWFCMNATHNSRCNFIFKYFAHYVPIIKPIKQFAYNFNKYEERLMKESNDYWFCMNATHNSRCTFIFKYFAHYVASCLQELKLVLLKTNFIYSTLRYTLLIEDDALPVPAFDPLMRSVVDRMDNDQRLDFIKLYHPGHLRKIPYYFQVI
uniref:Glycosyltransferase family 92 protein n=1 Tax=Ascaris lumbricoides TaxID=6252 RepID=A0A0M3IDM3_ASCLU